MFVPSANALIARDPVCVDLGFVSERSTAIPKNGSTNGRFEKPFPSAARISRLQDELMTSAWNRGLNQKTAVQGPGPMSMGKCDVAPHDAEFPVASPIAGTSAHGF